MTRAARCLAETGDVVAALGIANGLQPEYQRQRGLAEIASAQARAGDFDGARQTAKMIDDAGDQGIALHAIAKALAERHEFEVAREAKYREIRDAELDYRTGKLSREDYEAVDGSLRAEALEILNRLERLNE